MADKPVLSMKAASATGDVRVMHSVPHTMAAVVYSGKDENPWDEAVKMSRRAWQQANETVEKPANYSGINMLVELDSLQELKVKDARGKVFSEFCIFYQLAFFFNFY